jgi:hypothetical protein
MTRLPRAVTFLPGVAAAGWGWHQLDDPFHLEGLAVLEAAAVICWPVIVLLAVFGVPACLLALLPPRPVRRWWRARHPGMACWLLHWATGSPVGRDGARSAYIPAWLERVTYAADRYRCSYCRSLVNLAIDHLGPWSLGYLTVLFNLGVLCTRCNQIKSNAWIFRGRFWPGRSPEPVLAEDIVRSLRRRRWYAIGRYLRAAWALGA